MEEPGINKLMGFFLQDCTGLVYYDQGSILFYIYSWAKSKLIIRICNIYPCKVLDNEIDRAQPHI